jgi:hypothetical protein
MHMSDRYRATIWFPASALEDAEIKAVLEEEGVEFNPFKNSEYGDLAYGVEKGTFSLNSAEARWGQFEELEKLLKDKGIPFDRESGPYFDYIPERVIFRPAANGKPAQDLTFLLLGEGGEPAVRVPEIRNLLRQGVEALQAFLDREFPGYAPLSKYVKEG